MELHHRLRRDPSWHPNGCNICGQLGHQAAQCTTGTVNWRAMYGDHAFTIKPTIFQSDIEAAKKANLVDFDDLEKRARDYAKMREEQGGPPPQQAPPQRSQLKQQALAAAISSPAAASAAPVDSAAKEAEERKRQASEGLPDGWAVAFDGNQRPYFWHKVTKKTLWEKPTAATPIA